MPQRAALTSSTSCGQPAPATSVSSKAAGKRGRHVTVIEQEWKTSEKCEIDGAGWAVADEGDEDDSFQPCTVDWTMTRTSWDPARQRWSGKAEALPLPKRMPDRELPIAYPGAAP